MNTSHTLVKVIVPVYRDRLDPYERISLEQNRRVLGAYPFVFIHPAGLDISSLLQEFPGCGEEVFDDAFFRDIAGYNRLMMSADFYRRFSDTDYLLICQLDAYVFRDELADWCSGGYDYIGAPWPVPLLFRLPLLKQWRKRFHSRWRTEKDFKVGNGGFSLRKISKFRYITHKYKDRFSALTSDTAPFYPEDTLLLYELQGTSDALKKPSFDTALHFAFEENPKWAYKRIGNRLPFGCHAWYHPAYARFWKSFVN